MIVKVHVASAFSKHNAGGNKAGVVFVKEPLTNRNKKEIAKELGYAETAFVTSSERADYKIEYFTPKEEVDLCGHATIATFSVLMHLEQLTKSKYTIETKSGVLNIEINDEMIFMEQTAPVFYEVLSKEELKECFEIGAINNDYQIQIVSTGLKDILIPIKSEQLLNELEPNFEKIKELSAEYQVIGTHLYAIEGERIVCRNFAPLYDINEEAATGTSNGALACYLFEKHSIHKELYVFEQGASLKSLSEILVKLKQNDQQKISHVYVGGRGYYYEEKTLELD